MTTAYDSIDASAIPTDAEIVCGYDNGQWSWSAADWARFPNAQHVHISITASANTSQVLDVENGDATAAQAPGWVQMRRAAGQEAVTVYTSESNWPAAKEAFAAAQVAEPLWWIAWYQTPPVASLSDVPGASAKQYRGDVPMNGSSVDISITDGVWPKAAAPQPVPTPYAPEETAMILTKLHDGTPVLLFPEKAAFRPVGPAWVSWLESAGMVMAPPMPRNTRLTNLGGLPAFS